MSLTTIKRRATFQLSNERKKEQTPLIFKRKRIQMSLFLSSYENRLDTKGRISVPASFRAAVMGESFAGVVLFRSFTHNCIEGMPMSRMEQMAAATDKMGVFDSELDDLTAMLFADARELAFANSIQYAANLTQANLNGLIEERARALSNVRAEIKSE